MIYDFYWFLPTLQCFCGSNVWRINWGRFYGFLYLLFSGKKRFDKWNSSSSAHTINSVIDEPTFMWGLTKLSPIVCFLQIEIGFVRIFCFVCVLRTPKTESLSEKLRCRVGRRAVDPDLRGFAPAGQTSDAWPEPGSRSSATYNNFSTFLSAYKSFRQS